MYVIVDDDSFLMYQYTFETVGPSVAFGLISRFVTIGVSIESELADVTLISVVTE